MRLPVNHAIPLVLLAALVGTAGLSWPEAEEVRPAAFVWGVYVSPRARGQGLASAMMEALIERAGSYDGLGRVTLDCFGTSVGAIGLYRKLGFTALGVRPGYYSDNGEDAIEMILGFDPATGAVLPGQDEIRIDV